MGLVSLTIAVADINVHQIFFAVIQLGADVIFSYQFIDRAVEYLAAVQKRQIILMNYSIVLRNKYQNESIVSFNSDKKRIRK